MGAMRLEPAIQVAAAIADVHRVVWVAAVTGDLLNLNDLAWSRSGDPGGTGTIVIDDASLSILGVYPHQPPTGGLPTLVHAGPN
jgi:hypothetical protein